MIRNRRAYLPLIALLVALPLLATAFDAITTIRNSSPGAAAQKTSWLSGVPNLKRLAGNIDAGLRSGFALRSPMVFANAWIRYHLGLRATGAVLVSDSGRLFLLADRMIEQSAGTIRRDDLVDNTVAHLSRLKSHLDARGSRLVVAVPPNASTIYRDALPRWAQASGHPTEYDLLLAKARSQGIAAVDLRGPLKELRRDGAEVYYKRDTHWTDRGMLAAYNAIMSATGRPALALAAEQALGPRVARPDASDLVSLLGLANHFSGEFEHVRDEPGNREYLGKPAFGVADFTPFSVTGSNAAGPTIAIVGDSFTMRMEIFVRSGAAKVVWLHHQLCGFDQPLLDAIKPDEVWWMPTERYLNCQPDAAARPPH